MHSMVRALRARRTRRKRRRLAAAWSRLLNLTLQAVSPLEAVLHWELSGVQWRHVRELAALLIRTRGEE